MNFIMDETMCLKMLFHCLSISWELALFTLISKFLLLKSDLKASQSACLYRKVGFSLFSIGEVDILMIIGIWSEPMFGPGVKCV